MGVVTGNLGGSLGLGGIGGIDGGNALTINHTEAIKKSELICRGHPLKCSWNTVPKGVGWKRSSVFNAVLHPRFYTGGQNHINRNRVFQPLQHDYKGDSLKRHGYRRIHRKHHIINKSPHLHKNYFSSKSSKRQLLHTARRRRSLDGEEIATSSLRDNFHVPAVLNPLSFDIVTKRSLVSSGSPALNNARNQYEAPKQETGNSRNYVIRPVHRKPTTESTTSPSADSARYHIYNLNNCEK